MKNKTSISEKLPFKENYENNLYIRTFESNLTEDNLKWHTDDEDRKIICEHDTNWLIQFDNNLPQKIKKNTPIFIKKGQYHRLIKGDKKLTLKIKKYEN
jgi:hypothetical protein